jgi:hypothetical protein
MALKAVLESIEDLDEVLKGEYTEKDGKFYLDISEINAHPQVVALKNAHERQKTDNAGLKTKITELESKVSALPADFTVDEWNRLLALDDGDDPTKKKAKADERLSQLRSTYESQITALKEKYATDIAAKDGIIGTERTLRAQDKADLALDKAMDKANIDPKFRTAVRAMHKTAIKHSIEDDGTVRVFFESDLGEVEPETFLNSWSQSDDGKIFVTIPTGPSGSQTKGNSGITNNPFSAQFWNKTEQAALRNDPVKGERYARAAGFASLQNGLAATKAIQQAK